ncbi:PQ-loop domain-containing transporter [Jeongeupia naejangsanensis]|uniref:PQ-loop repeat-containing protein n=1 Tax=Jeongeupia naejangsanensis TaxID=613195 RepID=A0ABS2BKY6_9NEIS|nr:PQ-loop domain-containing transporter [Jeongeupia naejangsanensis]MBM3115733.1 hypothetical protein [Jeongeupia naejangsanensis]
MQISVPLMTLGGYIPQWKKLIRSKSSKDISLRTWLIWMASTLFGTFYAVIQLLINGRGWPLIISTASTFLFVTITVGLVLVYRKGSLSFQVAKTG